VCSFTTTPLKPSHNRKSNVVLVVLLLRHALHEHYQLPTLSDDSAGCVNDNETRNVHMHIEFSGERHMLPCL
jgi:hypothetical protein